MKRVLARYFGVEGYPGEAAVERRLWALAEACTPRERVAEYTQAIMDLGATVCTRARPGLPAVPGERGLRRARGRTCRTGCRRRGRARRGPSARRGWSSRCAAGTRCCSSAGRRAGIWGGLWGLPEFPTRAHAEQWCREHLSGAGAAAARRSRCAHAFSHFDYDLRPLVVRCLGKSESLRDDDRYRWYDARQPARSGCRSRSRRWSSA